MAIITAGSELENYSLSGLLIWEMREITHYKWMFPEGGDRRIGLTVIQGIARSKKRPSAGGELGSKFTGRSAAYRLDSDVGRNPPIPLNSVLEAKGGLFRNGEWPVSASTRIF
jgi:hypothetical protein